MSVYLIHLCGKDLKAMKVLLLVFGSDLTGNRSLKTDASEMIRKYMIILLILCIKYRLSHLSYHCISSSSSISGLVAWL